MAEFSIYAQRHGLAGLFQELLTGLLVDRPTDPIEHMIATLKRPPVLRVLVLGPPASGKHSLSALLAKRANAVEMSVAELVADAAADGDDLGKKAEGILAQGGSVPQDVLVPLVVRRIKKPDCVRKGYVLHGVPRTRAEALALQAGGVLPNQVLDLTVPDAVLLERFKGRRVDPTTGAVYHLTFAPPPAAIADTVVSLPRDTDALMAAALVAYHRQAAGIAACFSSILRPVNVDQPQDDAADQAWSLLCMQGESTAPFTPRVVLLGSPGSGRATLGQQLAKKYNIVYVNAGTLVRQAVAANTEAGQVCAVYVKRQALLPDTLMVKLLRERLTKPDCASRGWVLRGFPRSRDQAALLQRAGIEANRAVYLQLPEDLAAERLCPRRTDPQTGKTYMLSTAPADVVPRLVQHPRDTTEAVAARCQAWAEHAEDIADYYPGLQRISAQGEVARVFELLDGVVVRPLKKDPVA